MPDCQMPDREMPDIEMSDREMVDREGQIAKCQNSYAPGFSVNPNNSSFGNPCVSS